MTNTINNTMYHLWGGRGRDGDRGGEGEREKECHKTPQLDISLQSYLWLVQQVATTPTGDKWTRSGSRDGGRGRVWGKRSALL